MLFPQLLEIVDPTPHDAAMNMAIDEVLLRSAGAPLLRIYEWAGPAISFGYFEKWGALAVPPGWGAVRRWTGGGVVPHGEDVTYTLVVPPDDPLARCAPAESYRRIHEIIAALLQRSGVGATLAPAAAPRVSSGCFENPAAADVLADGRKLAGAAQRRTRRGLLHQGSVQGVRDRATFAAGLPGGFGGKIERRVLSGAELDAARTLAAERYATAAWTQRF